MTTGAASSTTLGCTLVGGRRQLDAGEGVWLAQLAEFDARGDCTVDGCPTTVSWLVQRCGMSRPTAKERVRVSRALRDHPRILAALHEGSVSYSQVRAITRIRHLSDATETALLEAAQSLTADDLERVVRRAEMLREQDEPGNGLQPWERSGMRTYPQFAGLETVELTVTPEQSARLRAVVDARIDHEFHHGTARPLVDSAISTGDTPEVVSPEAVSTDVVTLEAAGPLSLAARRLEALLDLVEAGVVALERDGEIDVDQATLNVILDYDTLVERRKRRGIAESAYGTILTGDAARRLAGDAGVVRLVTRGPSLVLDTGTRTRQWNRAQRRTIRARHGYQCAIKGCGRRITHIHHVQPVGADGPTDVHNGIPLCPYHHRLVHEGGWAVAYDAITGVTTLTDPAGRHVVTPPLTYDHLMTDACGPGGPRDAPAHRRGRAHGRRRRRNRSAHRRPS